MNRTNGKIADESRQKLTSALVALMETYDYGEITVTQLAQESGLSRKTFYRLFGDKDKVLTRLFDQLYSECLSEIQARGVRLYWELVQFYFDFWGSRKEILVLLGRNGLLSRLFDYAYRNAESIFLTIRAPEIARDLSGTLPYMLAYSVGGMHSMLIKWVEAGMNVPSSELIARLEAGFRSPEL